MILTIVAVVGLLLALIPCALFISNLALYRTLPTSRRESTDTPMLGPRVSVLIPARNEEGNVTQTLDAVLHPSGGCEMEVIVLDDHSTDRTAELVTSIANRDSRVRLAHAPTLPSGWCGKQHACHVLAGSAKAPLLLFLDADVRLAPQALERMVRFMEQSDVALASGVPLQELGTFSEKLLLPLIHFILLGFLPMKLMRSTTNENVSAGCGQLFIARRDAYMQVGGHAMIRASLHDGLKLPRVFRRAGFKTDLFDATDIATCRMYHTNAETWRGLGKNASEGLGARETIVPMTLLLLLGQVLPFVLLALGAFTHLSNDTPVLVIAATSVVAAFVPRLLAARLFRQPLMSVLLHPFGVLALLAIQWMAFARQLTGKASEWKGRSYSASTVDINPIHTIPSAQ